MTMTIFKYHSPRAPLELSRQVGDHIGSITEVRFDCTEYCALLTAVIKRNISVKLSLREGLLLLPSTESLQRRL